MSGPVSDAATDDLREGIARAFHENYERLAPEFGYATREASAVPWEDVPEQNKALMVATVDAVLAVLEGWVPPQLEQVGRECMQYGLVPMEHRCGRPHRPVFRLRVEGERE